MNEIYSVKLYPNLFVYTCFNIEHSKLRQYVISETRNDIAEIVDHLEKVTNQIGYGNLDYDYYLLHSIIEQRSFICKMQAKQILESLNNVSNIIKNGEMPEITKRYMSQMDLESFFGFSSAATSLEDLKIDFAENNIIKTDFRFTVPDVDIKDVCTECVNTIRCLVRLYYVASGKSKKPKYTGVNLISARYKFCEETSLPGTNYTPASFATHYFLRKYKQYGGKENIHDLVKLSSSNTSQIELKDCVPYYAMYSSLALNNVVDAMVKHDLSTGRFVHITNYEGLPLKFRTGGLHGCCLPGKYEVNNDQVIFDIDVVSMYATVAIDLGIRPRHMSEAFTSAMKDILRSRLTALNKADDVSKGIVTLTKSIFNYIYGKTIEMETPFSDNQYAYKVVIAAQCFMAKFMEALKNRIGDITFLMVNTDSITFIANKDKSNEVVDAISKMRTYLPSLRCKVRTFERLFVKDINNYLAVNGDNIVTKGIFDYEMEIGKDNSSLIVPKVVKDVLAFGKNPNDAIKEYSIEDFLIKTKGDKKLFYKCISNNVTSTKLIQNPSRYYYSTDYKSSGIILAHENRGLNQITDDSPVTLLNNRCDAHPEINYRYYLNKIDEILNIVSIQPHSQTLF